MKIDGTLLLVSQVARLLDVSAQTVRELSDRGVLRAERTPLGVRVFRREDVERLAAQRQAQLASR